VNSLPKTVTHMATWRFTNFVLYCIVLCIITAPLIQERSIVMSASVCLSVFVCPRSFLWNYASDLHQLNCARVFVCLL